MGRESNNTTQAFWVLVGSLSAFAFTLISSMFLSRYLNKHDYGTYRQVMYVYNTLLVVFTLGLPRAFSYFLPRVEKGQAKDLISKINYVLIILGVSMSIGLYFGSDFIAISLKNEDLSKSLKYFSLVPFFLLPTMGIEGILATYRKTFFLAIYNVLSKMFMLICVIIPIICFEGDVDSAIIGFTISSFFCFLSALYLKFQPIKEFEREKSPISYKQIFQYTLPILGASLWGIIINASDQFFISRYFGNEVFAEFANGSLELPFVSMIISSTAIVLSPVFSKHVYDGGVNHINDIINLWTSVLVKTIKLIYPLVVFCFCFADVIMIILYGEQYSQSGIYFQIKIVVNFFTVVAYAPLILAIGGEKYYYKVHMFSAILLIFAEWVICYFFKSSYLVTVVSVACQIGRIIAMLLFISHFFKIKLRNLMPKRLILSIVLPSFVILYCLKFLFETYLGLQGIFLVCSVFPIYGLVFLFWANYVGIDYISLVRPLFIKLKK